MSIFFTMAVIINIFIADFVEPKTMFASILIGTMISSVASLAIDIDIPA